MKKIDRLWRAFIQKRSMVRVFLWIVRLILLGLGLLGFTLVLFIGGAVVSTLSYIMIAMQLAELWRFPDLFYSALVSTLHFVGKIIFREKLEGRENIPQEGVAIIAARHRSIWDIPFMAYAAFHRRKVKFIARENMLWMDYLKPAQNYIIKISRGRKITKSQYREITESLENGEFLGIFPEGTRDPDDADYYGGFLRMAERVDAPIVPLNISPEGSYGTGGDLGWFRGLWARTFRTKISLKVGRPLKSEEIKRQFCRKYNRQKVRKEDYSDVAEFFLEEIVDQV